MTTMLTLPEIPRPDTETLDRNLPPILARAEAIVVDSPQSYESAGLFLKDLRGTRQQITAVFAAPVAAANLAHKTLTQLRNKFDDPVKAAEQTVKNKMGAWHAEEERKRQEAEAAVREAARKAEEEKRLAEAAALEEAGHAEEAEQVLEAPIRTTAVVLPKTQPKIQGLSTRKVWKFNVVNVDAIPRQYMIPDEKAIGAVVRSLGDKADIPGVEVYSETTTAVRV